jgi:hypothetical protein
MAAGGASAIRPDGTGFGWFVSGGAVAGRATIPADGGGWCNGDWWNGGHDSQTPNVASTTSRIGAAMAQTGTGRDRLMPGVGGFVSLIVLSSSTG